MGRNITLRDVPGILRRRQLVILGFFLSALAGGYVGLRFVSPVYRATAQLMVQLGQEDVFMPVLPSSSSDMRTPLTTGNLEHEVNAEVRIIESEPLAQQVLAKFGVGTLFPSTGVHHLWYTPGGLMQSVLGFYRALKDHFYPRSGAERPEEQALRRLRESISVAVIKDSTVIEVTMTSAVPDVAAEAVNELVHLYLLEREKIYQHETEGFFDAHLSELSTKLASVDQQIDAFRSQNRVVDVDQQLNALLKRLAEVRANRENEEVAAMQIQRRIGVLEGQMAALMPTQRIESNTIYQRIRDDRLRAQSELAPHHEAAANWAAIEARLTAQSAELARGQSIYTQLLQQQHVLQDSRKLYLQKSEEARYQQAVVQAHFGNVSVINWATADPTLVSPKFGLLLGGIVVIGLLGGVGLSLFFELTDDRIMSDRDVIRATGLPVIGRVGVLSKTRRKSHGATANPDSAIIHDRAIISVRGARQNG